MKFFVKIQFLFYFSMGFAFESKREKYNQFISKKRNYVLILSIVFVLITLLNFNLKYTYTLVSKILVELLAILGSLLTYSISYLISRKEHSGSSYFFKLILMNGLKLLNLLKMNLVKIKSTGILLLMVLWQVMKC